MEEWMLQLLQIHKMTANVTISPWNLVTHYVLENVEQVDVGLI